MSKYISVIEKKTLCESLAYDTKDGHWICGYDLMVCIENDDRQIESVPVMFYEYMKDMTADEILLDVKDSDLEIIEDNKHWDAVIKERITEWCINENYVSGSENNAYGIGVVVSLLAEHGLWKKEYANYIDLEKINNER